MPEPLLYMRRLADFGSWDHYLAKSLGPGAENSSAWYLYGREVYEELRVVPKHANFRDKPTLALSVILCMVTKYRWVLQGLRRRPKGPQPRNEMGKSS